MTNYEIIMRESLKLMKEGILKGTGKKITVTLPNTLPFEVEEPEPIHTFAAWKKLGSNVRKRQTEHIISRH